MQGRSIEILWVAFGMTCSCVDEQLQFKVTITCIYAWLKTFLVR